MSFLLRWGLMVVGLFILVIGVGAIVTFEPLDTEPELVQVDDLVAMANDSDPHFVSVTGNLDDSMRIYPTGIIKPSYTTTNVNSTYEVLDYSISQWQSLLGCTVHAPVELERRWLALQIIETEAYDKSDPGTLTDQRILAPVEGSGDMLWVLSSAYTTHDESIEQFFAQIDYTGRLTRFDDFVTNSRGLSHEIGEIRAELGYSVPVDAYVILDGNARSADHETAHYIPIIGTDSKVWALVTDAEELATFSQSIVGIMESQTPTFAKSVGVSVPSSIGLVNVGKTADNYNAREKGFAAFIAIFGMLCFGLGLGLTVLVHKARKWSQQQAQQAWAGTADAIYDPAAQHSGDDDVTQAA